MESCFANTNELSQKELEGILKLFNTVFSRSLTINEFRSQYTSTELGFSFHSFLVEDGVIIAHHAAFPANYFVNGQKMLTYYTGSTMVEKSFRDGPCFLEVVKNLSTNMKKLGYAFSFGFPNELSYKVFTRLKMCRDIGRLNIYVLPYRIGGIKKDLTILNPISMLCGKIWAFLHCFGGKKIVDNYMIHKDDDVYNRTRYNRLGQNYYHIKNDNNEFFYCIKLHENVRTAFLIDVRQKSQRNFRKAVWYILRNNRKDFDMILYVGNLSNIGSTGLIRIPRRLEPKHFYVVGGIKGDSAIDESMFYNIQNWDLNLSNYDLI